MEPEAIRPGADRHENSDNPLLNRRQRVTDHGVLCWLALRFSELWDFIDKRDIDKHTVSLAVMYGSYRITTWAFQFAEAHMDKSGVELAAVLAAVIAPWSLIQTTAIKWYFESRSNS